MKLLLLVFITVLFLGCGVNTDSSFGTPTDTGNTDDNTTDSTGGNDTNTTDDTGDDLGDPNEDQINSDFDTRDAIKDQEACMFNSIYNGMTDSSFDPEETYDSENGIAVSSFFAYDPNQEKTEVVVYYPDLETTLSGTQIVITEAKYRVGFDASWPINPNKTIYVRTPRYIDSNYYGCIRYTLSTDKSSIVAQRVYRIRE